MPAQWTADIIGEMHLHSITAKQLAKQVGWNPKYLSSVLNGHRTPKSAETTVKSALNQLIARKIQERVVK